MISDEVANDGLAALSVAALMLIEDAADGLATAPTGSAAEYRFAATLAVVGADLSALAAAATVLIRHRGSDALRVNRPGSGTP